MKVLFIGGTGIISSACSELAISKGIELFHLNRGKSSDIRRIEGVKTILSNIRNPEETKKAIQDYSFDVVVDWISFTADHIKNSIKLFSNNTDQFIFISSASAYETPPRQLPVTEETVLDNPFWQYSRDKISCENILQEEFHNNGFPYTIVRPSHTYDKTLVPLIGGYTTMQRMKKGLPVLIHGDGTSIWTLTYNKDFAVGLVGLFGKPEAINEAYHITSDEWLSWTNIYQIIADELNTKLHLVPVSSKVIAKYDSELGSGLLGDKAHSMIFDNSKIKSLVPEFNPQTQFHQGVKEIVAWYKDHDYPQKYKPELNQLMEKIIEDNS